MPNGSVVASLDAVLIEVRTSPVNFVLREDIGVFSKKIADSFFFRIMYGKVRLLRSRGTHQVIDQLDIWSSLIEDESFAERVVSRES